MQADPSLGLIFFTFMPAPFKPLLIIGFFAYVF